MIELRINDIRPDRVLEIVRELRASGIQNGIDFDFAYHPADIDHGPYAAFGFYTEKMATFFSLKYL